MTFSQDNIFHQKIDHRIISKIYDLTADGVRNVKEMQRHLHSFVKDVLFTDKPTPSPLNRQFYPRKVDVRNHMYAASLKLRFSKLDQENVEVMIEQWKSEDPSSLFFLRPYELKRDESEVRCCKDNELHLGNNDEESDIKPVAMSTVKKFLFAYQSEWQRRLLQRYGNSLCLLDATYRTTKYALPLCFLAVKTNVKYIIVGSFVTQDEKIATL